MSCTRLIHAAAWYRPLPRRSFLADRRAGTSLEFGIVAIPFLILVMFVLGAGIQLFASATMQAAVNTSTRQMRIGNIRGTSDTSLRTAVCNQMSGLIASCSSTLQIYVTSGSTFGALSPATVSGTGLSTTGYTPGSSTNFVLVQVAYVAPALLPLPNRLATAFSASSAFRNEP